VIAAGTLQAVTTVEVGAQLSGQVQSLAAEYNSRVHAGQVLARLDPSTYEAQLVEARAALGQAQANELRALGTGGPIMAAPPKPAAEGEQRPRDVWTYDGTPFTPISVITGLADDQWTEVVSGAVRSGDGLVTSVAVHRHSRW
jgi:pyruvate/2-oxoglutarate dehydrogenase complex dihydrolipoamide acyltransferase (E2) component